MSSNSTKKSPQKRGSPSQQVRIIGGQWKRTPLPVLAADGLRPTPDRVRETVFNWLNHLLDGAWQQCACLDLFSGSGALGFEAASRGAGTVMMIEMSAPAVRHLKITKEKLHAEQVEIICGDAVVTAQRMAGAKQFDLIFLDPPYHQDWLAKTLPICKSLLREGGFVYAEAEVALSMDAPPDWLIDWEVIRADKAGVVFYHLLQCKK